MLTQRDYILAISLLALFAIAVAFYFLGPEDRLTEFTAMVILSGTLTAIVTKLKTVGNKWQPVITSIATAVAAATPTVLTVALGTGDSYASNTSRLWVIAPLLSVILYIGWRIPNDPTNDNTTQRRQQPSVQQRNRTLKTAERGFDAEILHLLETLTPAYPYKIPPHADPDIAHLCDFMVAESYLVEVKDGYMVTAAGRRHRQHLRRKPLVRWLSSNYQWFTAVAIAIASVAVATASVIVATFD